MLIVPSRLEGILSSPQGRGQPRAQLGRDIRRQRTAKARIVGPAHLLEVVAHLRDDRDFATRGHIEISTTPYYHPILPLLCDSDIAAVPHPGVALPPRFHYPHDAREQLERARAYMLEMFGVAPVGLWPSEGSVSDHALALAYDSGFAWAASDNGVLGRTLSRDPGVDVTYKPYVWQQGGREVCMIFRDHYLSDLIGFEYSRMGAADAAGHFLDRIRQNAGGRECLVPIILDGENAWEYYEANGQIGRAHV